MKELTTFKDDDGRTVRVTTNTKYAGGNGTTITETFDDKGYYRAFKHIKDSKAGIDVMSRWRPTLEERSLASLFNEKTGE